MKAALLIILTIASISSSFGQVTQDDLKPGIKSKEYTLKAKRGYVTKKGELVKEGDTLLLGKGTLPK